MKIDRGGETLSNGETRACDGRIRRADCEIVRALIPTELRLKPLIIVIDRAPSNAFRHLVWRPGYPARISNVGPENKRCGLVPQMVINSSERPSNKRSLKLVGGHQFANLSS